MNENDSNARLDVGSEAFDKLRDGIREDLKRLDYWLIPKRAPFEEYAKGREIFIVDLDINAGPLDADNFRAACVIECLPEHPTDTKQLPIDDNRIGIDLSQADNHSQNTVLVGGIQLSQGIKGRAFASRVNFGLYEVLKGFGPNALYVPLCGGAKIVPSFPASGELQPVVSLATVDINHLPSKVIHGSSKIVNGISCNQWNALGRPAGDLNNDFAVCLGNLQRSRGMGVSASSLE